MGGEIDAIVAVQGRILRRSGADPAAKAASWHIASLLLGEAMAWAGFSQASHEWWHFSLATGSGLWRFRQPAVTAAGLARLRARASLESARFGRLSR